MSKATDIELQIVDDWNNNKSSTIVNYLKKMGCKGTATHIGKKQFPPSDMWTKYNKQKSYSKTDIIIGKHKISLKSLQEHIIMSAKKNEALATFNCVSNELYKGKLPDIITDVIDEMENMITKQVSPLSIKQSKKSGNVDIIGIEEKHRQLLEMVEQSFDDPTFMVFFIKEVLSGELKFGKESDGSATHILILNDTKPILKSLDDTSFLSNIAKSIEVRIDFKSVRKTQGEERGMYRYWSVMQMISRELLKDSVLYENSIIKKSLSYVYSMLSKIKNYISTWSDLFGFLEVEPEITIKFKG